MIYDLTEYEVALLKTGLDRIESEDVRRGGGRNFYLEDTVQALREKLDKPLSERAEKGV